MKHFAVFVRVQVIVFVRSIDFTQNFRSFLFFESKISKNFEIFSMVLLSHSCNCLAKKPQRNEGSVEREILKIFEIFSMVLLPHSCNCLAMKPQRKEGNVEREISIILEFFSLVLLPHSCNCLAKKPQRKEGNVELKKYARVLRKEETSRVRPLHLAQK